MDLYVLGLDPSFNESHTHTTHTIFEPVPPAPPFWGGDFGREQ